jgi:hypothetical protein
MDYTTLEQVKLEMRSDIAITTDDVLIGKLITAASRALDRRCTGVADTSAHNYFMYETKTNEKLNGLINADGEVICYPHKPQVDTIISFSYRKNIVETEYFVDASRVSSEGCKVVAYPINLPDEYPSKCKVDLSYTGGFSGSTAGLPEDFQEICALLAIRFYKEAATGMSDVIGVAEIGQLMYTKAWPQRVVDQLDSYIRRQGWRYPG